VHIVPIDVRKPDDAEEIWALQHPAYRAEAALIGVADLPPLRDTVESLRRSQETFVGCRLADGELIGAISYERSSEIEFEVCRLMVHPAYFRQGIGSLLLSNILASAPHSVAWTVTAEIRNFPALLLYEKHGFVRTETFRPTPDIEMVRFLRSNAGGER
jgi:ribosomal protein S18 acetylase RimI-like enzyme